MQVDEQGRPLLDQFSEEGFIDCVFQIQNLHYEPGCFTFHMTASFEGEPVGLDAQVVKEIKAGFDENMELIDDHVYRDGVKLSRSGPESDKLISAITRLYNLDIPSTRMVDAECYTAIALHQGEIDIESQPVKLKLFGRDRETDQEDDYNESFFNLDLKNGLVFWNEKDQEYRTSLVKSLSASPGE
jgi:hypothetical protein